MDTAGTMTRSVMVSMEPRILRGKRGVWRVKSEAWEQGVRERAS